MKHKHRCITRTVETTPSRAVLGWFIHTCLGCGRPVQPHEKENHR